MIETRTNNFDGIRIIAASMVIIGHAYALTGKPPAPVIWQNVIHGFALEIFFSISGYLILKSFFYDPNFGRFLAKRALRIFPA
nr:acyltransferase family protein [Pseudomonadota bacterium]